MSVNHEPMCSRKLRLIYFQKIESFEMSYPIHAIHIHNLIVFYRCTNLCGCNQVTSIRWIMQWQGSFLIQCVGGSIEGKSKRLSRALSTPLMLMFVVDFLPFLEIAINKNMTILPVDLLIRESLVLGD